MARPFEILRRSARGEPAAWDLWPWAQALTARAGIPEEHADDVASECLLRLHTRAPEILARLLARDPRLAERTDDADRVVTAYFRRMVSNAWIDRCRREGRDRALAERLQHEPTTPDASDDDYSQARDGLQTALDHVLATRKADPEHLAASVTQLFALADGSRTMEELVDEEITADDASRERARERLYRRHRLARAYLADAVDQLARAGDMDPETVDLVRGLLARVLVRRVVRRPIVQSSVVSKPEDKP